MPDLDVVSLALAAGLVAAVNPCGFALLPAYLSLFVLDDEPSRPVAVVRALRATALMTLGFAGVFALFGLAIMPVAASVQQYLPWFTVAFGAAIALAGVWVLAGRRLPGLSIGRRRGRPITTGTWSMIGFGSSYAVASLGCTIAPFLAVVVTAFRAGSTAEGMVLFLAYAFGMAVVVGTAAVAVALARRGVITGIRRAGRFLPRLGGALLLVAGAYVAWYGAWELRVLHADAGADPVVEGAGEVQRRLSDVASAIGWPGFLLALALLVGVGLLTRRRRGGSPATPSTPSTSSHEQERL